jgi:hypothetical protein
MKRSRNRACTRTSGPICGLSTPVSRSTAPSRRGALSLPGLGTKHKRTPGACALALAMSAAPKFSTNPSRVRKVNVRTSCASFSWRAGRSTAAASSTSCATGARSSSARGVGTRPRPALTSKGSPVVSRKRAKARLMAEGLSRKRSAARATLPSANSTSKVTNRLKSGFDMHPSWQNPILTWRQVH